MTPDDLSGLAKSLEAAKDYADIIVKGPLEQIGGLLADSVGFWRLKNRVNVLLKAKEYCEERGVNPEKLLPSVFVPLIDAAGDTDDDSLQEMFAELLATSIDPARQENAHPSFAKAIGQLSPLDAHVMRVIDDKDRRNFEQRPDPFKHPLSWRGDDVIRAVKAKHPNARVREIQLSLTNLAGLESAKIGRTCTVGPMPQV